MKIIIQIVLTSSLSSIPSKHVLTRVKGLGWTYNSIFTEGYSVSLVTVTGPD